MTIFNSAAFVHEELSDGYGKSRMGRSASEAESGLMTAAAFGCRAVAVELAHGVVLKNIIIQ